ncbi:hypothetical protein BFP70_05290 [Thioclava sp. SK-1]|uniref:glycosyltransferase family 2 protein n=1 Tax=Thioclava sp. SK-1 TaxID=1889770 RepID=UPI000824B2A6|nr:glycosyltransferase [Thioclava sp. SK-1]OCX66435.1 hypothetical protein BFP70_05290 [Thioclava sp. SK-1]
MKFRSSFGGVSAAVYRQADDLLSKYVPTTTQRYEPPRAGAGLMNSAARKADPAVRLQGLDFSHLDGLSQNPASVAGQSGQTGCGAALEQGAKWVLDGYHDIFALGLWRRACALGAVQVQLRGIGALHIQICGRDGAGNVIRGPICPVQLQCGAPHIQPLPDRLYTDAVLLWIELFVPMETRIDDLAWVTSQPPLAVPHLAIVITTYRREPQVRALTARLSQGLSQQDGSPYQGPIPQVLVIDNGGTLDPKDPHFGGNVTLISSPNLGGSGGFARGILEARAAGATHCLFMDDDASAAPEAVWRCRQFLAYATDPAWAVAGALTQAERPDLLWENGARFDRFCTPCHKGTNLTERSSVHAMIVAAEAHEHHGALVANYGGWWFFGFALDAVRHMPFPFFVRGDDVGFSLANDLRIATLPGVVAGQDEDFAAKESPLTGYLDLRSHLVHHLALRQLGGRRRDVVRIALRFGLRALVLHRHDSLSAMTLAVSDVCAGPERFAQMADLQERREQIAQASQTERPQPAPQSHLAQISRPQTQMLQIGPLRRLWARVSLNGYLLPGMSRWGHELSTTGTAVPQMIWGARTITRQGLDGTVVITSHDPQRGRAEFARFLRAVGGMLWHQRRLRRQWQAQYGALTSVRFWQDQLSRRR